MILRLGALILFASASLPAAAKDLQIHTGPMVLAMSWQPAFCERAKRRPECRTQKNGRYDTSHFSLHGLWPQPGNRIYCAVDDRLIKTDKRRRWRNLPPLGLSQEMRKALWRIMPGSRSFLHRHEWIKHGTCYSRTAERYYRDSVSLMDAINRSEVRDLFARNIGRRLTNRQIRTAFDKAFGRGAGKRVRVSCKRDGRRELIVEITLGLSGEIGENPDISELISASPQTKPGCPAGIVDPAGFQ